MANKVFDKSADLLIKRKNHEEDFFQIMCASQKVRTLIIASKSLLRFFFFFKGLSTLQFEQLSLTEEKESLQFRVPKFESQ